MAEEIHVGDIGTVFRATIKDGQTVLDVSTATVKQLIFQKPDGSSVTKDAVFTSDGTDGQVEYGTVENDLNVKGDWKLQGYVVLPTGKWHSDIHSFRVYENL